MRICAAAVLSALCLSTRTSNAKLLRRQLQLDQAPPDGVGQGLDQTLGGLDPLDGPTPVGNPNDPTDPLDDPTDPNSPTDPTGAGDPTDVNDPTDPTVVNDPDGLGDPTDANDPTDPTGVNDPDGLGDLTGLNDPTDPTDPTGVNDPTDPTEVNDPNDPDGLGGLDAPDDLNGLDSTPAPSPLFDEQPTPGEGGGFDFPETASPTVGDGGSFGAPTEDTPAPTAFGDDGGFDTVPTLAPVVAPTLDAVPTESPVTAPTWGAVPTESPVTAPVWNGPSNTPYIPKEGDPLEEEIPNIDDEYIWNDSTLEDLEHDRTVLIALCSVFGVGICLAIITAQQMLDNPGGCCASICRIFVACTCAFTRCVCYPCRAVCGCTSRNRRTHEMVQQDHGYTHDLELS